MDIGSILFGALPLLALAGLAFFMLRRGSRGGNLVCTRCDGTGQVNERWPDPKEPSGWHQLEGICPKCKGRGKV